MTHNVTKIEDNKWLVEVSFHDEGVDRTTSNKVIGTEEQAHAYAATLARDYRENNADLFPLPEVEEEGMMEDIE